ncbi:MAG: methyl-accepting chemotaxis protein [Polyangiaceae bacterium]
MESNLESDVQAAKIVDLEGQVAAIGRSQAVIEFDLQGNILIANQNFLDALGYRLDEIQGKHHSLFVEPHYARSDAYRDFWSDLRQGRFASGEYKRLGKGGKEVWIRATYNPIFDRQGKPMKVVKYATDITAEKLKAADVAGQLAAIGKSQAVIEFDLDGTILGANQNFLSAMGYTLEEVQGRHHSLFVEPEYAASADYRAFWQRLRSGQFDSGVYKRRARGGKEIWIQASYNPILDANGVPFKVVKYATDVTAQKVQAADYSGQLEAIGKSQAVIEFELDGTIVTANQNFLDALGYRLEEIRGKHHRMFVEPGYARGEDYRRFWSDLAQGRYCSGEYLRIGKDGREVWIQAAYNPILDLNGRPFKVVKYATDITSQKKAQRETERLVAELQRVIESLASGDLTHTMGGSFEGAFALLKEQMNKTIDTLRSTVQGMEQASTAIRSAASDISEGNSNLNRRTQDQSSALEETASSLEEMTATVKQNAANATQAKQLAAGARELAEKGGQVVESAVTAMSAITESSKKVADIIGVIEQIAFQTNMLALNAAVEAARAGDQGRGFAVVAAEVRNLAQRSASAAKEIKGLIQDSREKVDQGAKLVNHSGETLAEIVRSVKKVSDVVGEISAASDEQATGIDQINAAVAQMDKSTQQNAAMVEEAAAAAETMSDQAVSLSELVGFFNVEAEAEPEPARAGNGRNGGRTTSKNRRPARVRRSPSVRPPAPSADDGFESWAPARTSPKA